MKSHLSSQFNNVDDQSLDERAIKQLVADAERFQNDAEAFAGLLTEDITLINFTGIRLIGRDEVYRVMKQAVASSLARILTKQEVEYINFLRPDVAIMTGIKSIVADADDLDFVSKGEQARLTFVLVKHDNEWLISHIQNTPIQSS
jgi:uncharacterized protein (TIGR02246 family)